MGNTRSLATLREAWVSTQAAAAHLDLRQKTLYRCIER